MSKLILDEAEETENELGSGEEPDDDDDEEGSLKDFFARDSEEPEEVEVYVSLIYFFCVLRLTPLSVLRSLNHPRKGVERILQRDLFSVLFFFQYSNYTYSPPSSPKKKKAPSTPKGKGTMPRSPPRYAI